MPSVRRAVWSGAPRAGPHQLEFPHQFLRGLLPEKGVHGPLSLKGKATLIRVCALAAKSIERETRVAESRRPRDSPRSALQHTDEFAQLPSSRGQARDTLEVAAGGEAAASAGGGGGPG